MKKLMLVTLFAIFAGTVRAQDVKFPIADTSPADIAYYPLNVAKTKDDSAPLIKVIYSRPSKNGREIFGVLEQFGKVWRLGANESTEIKFYKPAVVGGQKIPAGTYSLFAIPNKESWTMVINKQTDKWGLFYNEAKDIARVNVPVKTLTNPLEILSLTFTDRDKGANLIVAWDKTYIELPIDIK